MIYRFTRWIVRLTLISYFRNVFIKGNRHLETTGPVIFVANHPSAFMDPMVIATIIRRPIHFLAGAEFFGKGLKSILYKRHFHMIPVYRPSTMPGEAHRNVDTFSACYDVLGKGGAVLVFPEGNSVTETRIRKIKTGVARIALGAMEKYAMLGDVRIVPIGLNYSNPHRFRSELFINVGEAISAADFLARPEPVNELTKTVEDRMKKTSLHVDSEALDSLVKKVVLLQINNLRNDKNTKIDEAFRVWQTIARSLENWKSEGSQSLSEFEMRLDEYLSSIRKIKIDDACIKEPVVKITFMEVVRLIGCFPLFVFGFLLNSGPYYITVFVFRKMKLFEREGFTPDQNKVNPAFKGSVAMAVGMVIFIFYYLGIGSVAEWWSPYPFLGFAGVVFTFLLGLLTINYLRWDYMFRQKFRVGRLKRNELQSLLSKRKDILNMLEVRIAKPV